MAGFTFQMQLIYPRILLAAALTALVLYVSFAISGYAFFGNEIEANIFSNLECPCEHSEDTARTLSKIVKGSLNSC
jgi:hypothetical protein